MAAKKAATKLAKSGDVLETMAKAGIEVKLTKTEIADYIAEKAQEELQSEIEETRQELAEAQSHKVPVYGKWKDLTDTINAITGDNQTWVVNFDAVTHSDDKPYRAHINSIDRGRFFTFAVKESEVPEITRNILPLMKRYSELRQRLSQLETKKHRILLIERILSGTESGKVVLGDLTKLVNKLVKE